MRFVGFDEMVKVLKEKLGLDLEDAIIENDWCGDTESGFYTEYEVDMEKLNEEIDRFSYELTRRSE